MALSAHGERQLQLTARHEMGKSDDVMKNLRMQCLSRGSSGIMGLGRVFRIMDDSGNKKLSKEEFNKGLHDYGLRLSQTQMSKSS